MLAIFLKYPKAGKVKTRIAQDTDPNTATRIYKLLAEDVINNLKELPLTLHYDGCSLKKITQWLPNFNYEKQSDGDLGNRLIVSSEKHFANSKEKLIIIGTDCVEITIETIKETINLLDENDLVVGPTNDGGYYLIAVKNHHPKLFYNIDWSSEKVFQQTINNANELGLIHKNLQTKRDIDYWYQVPQKYKNQLDKL